jgi:hypothetical protein
VNAKQIVKQLLGEDINPGLEKLQRDLIRLGYEVEFFENNLMAQMSYDNSAGGAFELQVSVEAEDQFRVMGDYMSELTTAAVGLDFTGTADEVLAAIKNAEISAEKYADRES